MKNIDKVVAIPQVQVNGFDYTGFGCATNKKDAETNAARDFVGFLIGAGFIPADSVPDEILVINTLNTSISKIDF